MYGKKKRKMALNIYKNMKHYRTDNPGIKYHYPESLQLSKA